MEKINDSLKGNRGFFVCFFYILSRIKVISPQQRTVDPPSIYTKELLHHQGGLGHPPSSQEAL